MSARTVLAGLLFLSLSLTGWIQEIPLDPELEEFLIEQEAEVEKGDLVLKVSLVAIVPSSKRVIVKTEGDEKTLALALADKYKIRERIKSLEAKDLKPGDILIMVLQSGNLNVKEIHRFKQR